MNTILTDDELKAECRLLGGNPMKFARAIEAAVLAKLAQQADRQRVPEGWKLVPVEPTPEMVRAIGVPGSGLYEREAWSAMLAAAPEAPAQAVAAHRVLRKNTSGKWVCDGRYWVDGAPSGELLAEVEKAPDSWRVECVYRNAAGPEAPAQASAVDWRDRKDAERYRWLFGCRTKEQCEPPQTSQPSPMPQDRVLSNLASWYCTKEDADAAIDSARAALAQKGSAELRRLLAARQYQPEAPNDPIRVACISLDGITLTVSADQLNVLGVGDEGDNATYTLTFKTMTRAEYEAMGEFNGF